MICLIKQGKRSGENRLEPGMNRKLLIIAIFPVLVIAGCTKRVTSSKCQESVVAAYDTSAFDYIYVEALKQKLMGNAGDALKYLEQSIKINPKSDAAYFQVAQILIQTGNLPNGKKYVLKAISLNPFNYWYLMMAGGLYYQEGKPDSALYYYNRIIELNSGRDNIKLNVANLYAEKGDYSKAEEIYTYLEGKYGQNEELILYSVRNLVNSGNYSKAEEKMLRAVIDNPGSVSYLGMLAEIYRIQGKNDKAIGVYNELMKRDPGNAQTLLSLADFAITSGLYDELPGILNNIILSGNITLESKLALLNKVIENEQVVRSKGNEVELALRIFEAYEKGQGIVKLIRPELYVRQDKKDKAEARLEEILKEEENNYFAWERLLFLLSENEDYDKLYRIAGECASKFNMSFPAKIFYASAATEKGLYDVALEELRKARIIAGNNEEMIVQTVVMEADVYYRKREYDKSFAAFREALQKRPGDIITLNNYAYYLAEQNRDLKEAESMIKLVIEKEPGNTTFLDTYAWVLFKRGDAREAMKIMEKIISEDPKGDSEWFEHYGYILKKLRKCEEAIFYWQKALGLNPSKSNLKEEMENCRK
jgi:tetratricopeptide (TPR) repeat protein